jgi:hypothetical protein
MWLHQSGNGLAEIFETNDIKPRQWHVAGNRYRARHYDSVDRWNNFRETLRFRTRINSMPTKGGKTITQRHTMIPLWPIAWLFAMPPAVWFQRYRVRRKRIRQGLCVKCGYDLRATPGRCPECGHEASSPSSRPSSAQPA